MLRPGTGELAAVFAGGAAGTLARAALVEAVPPQPGAWPWATFAVNVGGALLLALILARATAPRPLLTTGLCGALTTFSAVQLELLWMLDAGDVALAAAYAAASVGAGLLVVRAGTAAA